MALANNSSAVQYTSTVVKNHEDFVKKALFFGLMAVDGKGQGLARCSPPTAISPETFIHQCRAAARPAVPARR